MKYLKYLEQIPISKNGKPIFSFHFYANKPDNFVQRLKLYIEEE